MATRTKMQTEPTYQSLEKHMCFICPECGQEHKSQQSWRWHLNEKHDYLNKSPQDFNFEEIDDKFHECQTCYKWVANAHHTIALLQYHRFLHLPFSRTYQCRHCPRSYTRKRALCEHLLRTHNKLIDKTEKKGVNESSMDLTKAKDPKENSEFYLRFICPECGILLDRFQQWLLHIEKGHSVTSTDLKMHRIGGSRNHYCLLCRKLLYTCDKAKLQRHRFIHLPHKNYFQCAFCPYKKAYKLDILRHFIFTHKQEFAAAKDYIKVPIEWGGSVSEADQNLEKLIQKRISEFNDKKSNQQESKRTDLLQEALLNSCIDFEEDAMNNPSEVKTVKVSATEKALDQSLIDLEMLLRDDDDVDKKKVELDQRIEEEEELEAFYSQIFEQIDEHCENDESEYPAMEIIFPPNSQIKTEIKIEPTSEPEEQIISIEINALDDIDEAENAENAYQSPKRKRIKLSESASTNHEQNIDLKAILENHINYLCPECGKEFVKQTLWRDHVFREHNLANAVETSFKYLEHKSAYLCLECDDELSTTKHSDLQRHRFMHMPYQSYLKCILCNVLRSSKPKMIEHLQHQHASLVDNKVNAYTNCFRCNCGKRFLTKSRFQNHSVQCPKRIEIKNLNLENNARLLAHLKRAHIRLRKLKSIHSGGNT